MFHRKATKDLFQLINIDLAANNEYFKRQMWATNAHPVPRVHFFSGTQAFETVLSNNLKLECAPRPWASEEFSQLSRKKRCIKKCFLYMWLCCTQKESTATPCFAYQNREITNLGHYTRIQACKRTTSYSTRPRTSNVQRQA